MVADMEPQHSQILSDAIARVKQFYAEHTEIKASHGWIHIETVLHHTVNALESIIATPVAAAEEEEKELLSSETILEIQLAALLHDSDDTKYFPKSQGYPNASAILKDVGILPSDNNGNDDETSHQRILDMISWVGCSENGNSIPERSNRRMRTIC
eukprot:scaffold15311_cov136-Cylindrotheca_fusiformis.AAC.10